MAPVKSTQIPHTPSDPDQSAQTSHTPSEPDSYIAHSQLGLKIRLPDAANNDRRDTAQSEMIAGEKGWHSMRYFYEPGRPHENSLVTKYADFPEDIATIGRLVYLSLLEDATTVHSTL
ncbi:hypothetical protein DTO027B9_1622 [Paecilomyces variotii]|nr:hypothetical protein DTO027B9_1622 [Paecilomyces variotii]